MNYIYEGRDRFRAGRNRFLQYHRKLPEKGTVAGYTTLEISGGDGITEENLMRVGGRIYELTPKPEDGYRILGYLRLDGGEQYVCLTVRKSILPIGIVRFYYGIRSPEILYLIAVLFVTLAIAACLFSCRGGRSTMIVPSGVKDPTGSEAVTEYTTETPEPETQKYTVIDAIAYQGQYLEVSPQDSIPLGNNKENDGIYMQYVVKNSAGKEVYVSPRLNPGEKVDFHPCKYLDKGMQDVVITVNVFHQGTDMQDIGTDLNVRFSIQK